MGALAIQESNVDLHIRAAQLFLRAFPMIFYTSNKSVPQGEGFLCYSPANKRAFKAKVIQKHKQRKIVSIISFTVMFPGCVASQAVVSQL